MLWSGRGCVHPWDPARGPPAAPGARSQGLELSGLPMLCPLARGRSVRWTPRRLPRPGPRYSPLGTGTSPSLAPRSLLLGLCLRHPGGPRLRASSWQSLARVLRSQHPTPPPPLGLRGALWPGPLPSPLLPLSRLPRPREAPELPFRTRNPPNLGWTPFCRAVPPASPRRLRSCNLEAQLSTSGDFSLLSSPQAKFPERSRGLRAFTTAPGIRTRRASAAVARR